MLGKNEIVGLISDLNLTNGEYWVTAGAGLVLHGIKESARDIDIGCTDKVIDRLLLEGYPLSRTPDGIRAVKCGDILEFYENWFADEVVTIDGISVASPLSIRRQKAALGREKDMRDVKLIEEFIHERVINAFK